MEAKELRIGNYLNRTDVGDCKITGILENDFEAFIYLDNVSDSSYRLYMFNPIHLTEYWLKKLGFEYWDVSAFFVFQFSCFGFKYDLNKGFSFYDYERDDWFKLDYEINSVHQLQNLYFALMGQEMEIKP